MNTKDIKPITKKCKLIKTKLFLNSLTKINDISQLEKIHCYNFINNLDYSLRYKEELTYEVRRIVNWLYDTKKINFNSSCLFPRIVGQSRSNLIFYYNNDEIENLLNRVYYLLDTYLTLLLIFQNSLKPLLILLQVYHSFLSIQLTWEKNQNFEHNQQCSKHNYLSFFHSLIHFSNLLTILEIKILM